MNKKLLCLLIFALVASLTPHPGALLTKAEESNVLFINEVMASNKDTLRDGDVDDPNYGSQGGAYSDWIELYNKGSETIDLTSYTLEDSSKTWEFPQCTINPEEYLLVWASDKDKVTIDGQLHTNFKISSDGELLTLNKPDGSLVDSVITVALKDNQSYGRINDGFSQWGVFSSSTPNSKNISSQLIVKDPIFSHAAGFYDEAIDLKLSSGEEDVKIYFTTDGSDPVPEAENTSLYQSPVNIKSKVGLPNVLSMISNISNDKWNEWKEPIGEVFKCSIVKAVAIRDDGQKSQIITNTYFVEPNMKDKYELPIISLITDEYNLFDDETGIYVNENFENKGREWERPVHVEYFEKDGTLALALNSGMRINGGYSRKVPQKSFRLYADHGYNNEGKFKYDFFTELKNENGKIIDSFKRLVLRNGGSDTGWTGIMFRDGMMQSLVSHLSIDTLAFKPSVVFLNGEFWGIYNIRERYDNEYLASHYDFDKDKAVILDVWEYPSVQEGQKGDQKAYTDDVIGYLKTNSITDPNTYEYIKTKIDIKNYIEYNVSEIFFGNYDWPANNTSIWRYKTDDGEYHPEAPYGQDGRWRWLLRDLDFGCGLLQRDVTFDTLSFATADKPEEGDFSYANQPWSVFLLKTLLSNTEFRNDFISCFADQLNTSFDPVRVNQKIDECKAAIEKAMPYQSNRWRVIDMVSSYQGGLTWEGNINDVRNYADKRPSIVREQIVNKFKTYGVTGTSDINIKSDTDAGYVRINSIDIKSTTPGITNPSNWSGVYFNGVPVSLTAYSYDGYEFDHWEGISEDLSKNKTLTFVPFENMNITAVYSPSSVNNSVFKLEGYIKPDISEESVTKEGFRVQLVDTDLYAITDFDGYFQLDNVPENSIGYTVRISKDNYLTREIDNIVINEDKLLFEKTSPGEMWAGDIIVDGIQDNAINIIDIAQVAKSFNCVKGNGGYNQNADLNMDKVVNMADFMAIAKHFNTTMSSY